MSENTIFDELRADHDTQRTLMDLLEKTEGDSEGRRELFGRFKRALRAHAAAEERVFYRALLDHGMTQERARHSMKEHAEADELLEDLENRPMDDPGWLPTLRKLVEANRHHVDEEEEEVFPLAGRVLDGDAQRRMASRFRRLEEEEREAA
ncbi:MAG TPA: hemerythrin domain-containing protein [Sandaracinaceae bacterium LLY-WYZ-13_1]|nr:hemerythrin domain-containing protein [Sandaracinaceae bacterium LLY-WYZ-13_1]